MSLMPKILIGRELQVDALRLKNHADLPPHARRFLRRIATHDSRASGARNHQRGKNSKERGLPAAIRAEQPNNSAGRTSNETPFRAVRFS